MRKFMECQPVNTTIGNGVEFIQPFQQLSVFCRHYDTGEALRQIPLYCIAEIGVLGEASRDKTASEVPLASETFSSSRTLVPERIQVPETIVYPLGQIVTDQMGYASFDLTPLHQREVKSRINSVFGGHEKNEISSSGERQQHDSHLQKVGLIGLWVLPFLDSFLMVNALSVGEISPSFVAYRCELTETDLEGRIKDQAGASMQNANILDWRLSPGSFTMSAGGIIGDDGCETLLPTNLAAQQFRFRQVFRNAAQGGSKTSEPLQLAYVAEYMTEWFPIGHSLGQILYSLPLAPGEKVKIAVVDWARRDTAARAETTTFMEQLDHSQIRDRTLSETVNTAVREWQSGSSVMGGTAGSVGVSIPLQFVQVGIGGTHSLGASKATMKSSRRVTGETVQKISDTFQQASSAMRELHSTVVVQSDQGESSNVQTRVVANYNHSHALTMLYYEVLRHYRIITRTVSVRPALMVKFGGVPKATLTAGGFTTTDLTNKRFLLEPLLLDKRYAAGFDIAAKAVLGQRRFADAYAAWQASVQTVNPADKIFVTMIARFNTGGTDSTEPAFAKISLFNGYELPFELGVVPEGVSPEYVKPLTPPLRWGDINRIGTGFQDINSGGSWKVLNINYDCVTAEGERVVLVADGSMGINGDGEEISDDLLYRWLDANKPPAAYTYFPEAEPKEVDFVPAEDAVAIQSFLDHFNGNRGYYLRLLRLTEDPNERLSWLDSIQLNGTPVTDLVDNVPLEIYGDYVAFAVTEGDEARKLVDKAFDGALSDSDLDLDSYVEQLATLPTRGVFGEAKLGHCNASEIIDTTRFWDWQSSPIPDDAPAITGADAGTRAQDGTEKLSPTSFPQSIVNIATPQALPDPTGLSGAFGVLSALGAFKDITGQKELAGLLATLSNNATTMGSNSMTAGKSAETKRMMDVINSAPGLDTSQKKALTQQLLASAVNPSSGQAAAAQAPATTSSPPATSGGTAVSPPPTGGNPAVVPVDGDGSPAPIPPPAPAAPAAPAQPVKPPTRNKPPVPERTPVKGMVFRLRIIGVGGGGATGYMNSASVDFVDEILGFEQFPRQDIGSGSGVDLRTLKEGTGGMKVMFTLNRKNPYDFLGEVGSVGSGAPQTGPASLAFIGDFQFDRTPGSNEIPMTLFPLTTPKVVSAKTIKQAAETYTAQGGVSWQIASISLTGGASSSFSSEVSQSWTVYELVKDQAQGGMFKLDYKKGH